MTARARIALATGEPELCGRLQTLLSALGYDLAGTAGSTEDAARLDAEAKPDLFLIDMRAGGDLNGPAAAAAIRRQSGAPVIFLLSAADLDVLPQAKAADPIGFLRLPLDDSGVRVTLKLALDKLWAERQLRESESRLRRLVESTTDYIYTVQVQNGRPVSTVHGPACVAVTGYTSAEYNANPLLWISMVCPEDRERVKGQAARILNGESVPPLEHRIVHKNGQVRWLRNTAVPHHAGDGRLISYDGLVSDITARKTAELQLLEHARQLEIVNRVIGAVNRAADAKSLLAEVLRASLELVRFTGGGLYVVEAQGEAANLVSAQGLPPAFLRSQKRLAVDAPPYQPLFEDGRGLFASPAPGAPGPAAPWPRASLAYVPLTAKNKVIGVLLLASPDPHVFSETEKALLLAVGRQIGTALDKLRGELALRESEAKYRTISEQSLVGIHIIKENRLLFVNDGWTRISGYTRDDIRDWGFEDITRMVVPEDRAAFTEHIRKQQVDANEDAAPVRDFRFLSKTGETKWVRMVSRSTVFADGRAALGVIMDITERQLALQALEAANRQLRSREQELLGANRDKEALLKEIHHRVKNNLQVVSSLLRLQMGHVRDPQAVAGLQECQNRIKSIAIVHEKLYQSRSLAEVDIGPYIRGLTAHLFRTFLVDPDSVAMDIAVESVSLDMDQAIPCSLIINELVSNALKYAFPDGRRGVIRIRLQAAAAGRYRLEVGDNGVGWPPGLDFRQTASLGMQLVLAFVRQLNGAVERGPGPGTVFVVDFPAGRKASQARAHGESNSASQDENLVS